MAQRALGSRSIRPADECSLRSTLLEEINIYQCILCEADSRAAERDACAALVLEDAGLSTSNSDALDICDISELSRSNAGACKRAAGFGEPMKGSIASALVLHEQ